MEELSEAELDTRLAKVLALPNAQQRAGGVNRLTAWALMVFSGVGMWASLALVLAEKKRLTHPELALKCDLNPLIGCGKWIGTWQNEVFFGISNSVFGVVGFFALAVLGIALLLGSTFSSRFWQLLSLATVFAGFWIIWFMYQAYWVKSTLCPYCFVVWLVSIPLIFILWARVLQAGHWGKKVEGAGRLLVRNRFLILGMIYFMLISFTVFWFWNEFQRIL